MSTVIETYCTLPTSREVIQGTIHVKQRIGVEVNQGTNLSTSFVSSRM